MIPVTVAVPDNKVAFFKELVNSLNFKEIDPLTEVAFDVPEAHKTIVLERIKNAKQQDLLKWDDVKDSFKLD